MLTRTPRQLDIAPLGRAIAARITAPFRSSGPGFQRTIWLSGMVLGVMVQAENVEWAIISEAAQPADMPSNAGGSWGERGWGRSPTQLVTTQRGSVRRQRGVGHAPRSFFPRESVSPGTVLLGNRSMRGRR